MPTPAFFAVAANVDQAFLHPEFKALRWIPLKTRSVNFVNCLQVHFTDLQDAINLYARLQSLGIQTFRNWK